MRLEFERNRRLLTRIKSSLAHDTVNRKIGEDGKASTRLFDFERLECYELQLRWNAQSCIKVNVVATGEQFVVTHEFGWGELNWSLYKIVDGD